MNKVKNYIDKHKDRFINELFDLLRIPSISAQSEHKADMQHCAEWLAAALSKAGADRADVMPTDGNPVVYAEKIIDPKAKTVLVYGHYDVMPVDPGPRCGRRQRPTLDARQSIRGDVRDRHAPLQRKIHARRRRGNRLSKPLQIL